MKKIFYPLSVFIFSVFFSTIIMAQGVHQLWGITTAGGTEDIGAIFKANGDGTNAQGMFSFTRENPGSKPMYNQLAEYNGKFYAMASEGGSSNLGVIFEWDPVANVYIKKYDFDGTAGSTPYGNLVLYNNKFYGMTVLGGANNLGVIFEWDPATNTYTKKYDFDGTNGDRPFGSLTEYSGKFYGMTNTGGANNQGVIFEWDPAANTYTKKHDFNGTDGANPYGHLAVYSGKFYGLTNVGGVLGAGVIFEWDPATNTYTKKVDLGTFSDPLRYGDRPFGSLVLESGKFYYMTYSGGSSNGKGGIFEWDPVTNIAALRLAFGGLATVENPYGNLLFENGKFYGMGSIRGTGAPNAQGGLFEWDPVTNVYTIKYQYTRGTTVHLGYTGATPFGSLVAKAGKIYGMTSAGGDDNKGVIFEFDPVASTYTKKINFMASPNGRLPESGLSYNGTNIYGVTKRGGSEGLGTIFEWDLAAGQFNKKYDFNPGVAEGRMPVGTKTSVNGKYYGVTWFEDGVVYASTVIYQWDPVTNVYILKSPSGPGRLPVGKLVESGGKIIRYEFRPRW